MKPEPVNTDRERRHVVQARALVDDLFARRPGLYWLDLAVTATLTWGLVAAYFLAEPGSPIQIAALVLAAIGIFRAGTFIHEIVHFRRDEMNGFKRAWNLVVGVPALSPWVLYRNHIEHHSRLHFGTPGDGEYLPLARVPPIQTLWYLAQPLLLPPLAAIRFGLLGPLSRLSPGLREWVLTRASAAVTNPYYRRRFPARMEPELERAEWMCFAWLAGLAALTVFGPMQPFHWLLAWALLSLALMLNWWRNLAAHGYDNEGQPRSHLRQLDDSINLTGQPWLTSWLFPVGLKYHALHHLLPGLPYHQLGRAHRRLVSGLPSDHPYQRCNHRSYFRVIGRLFRSALASRGRVDVIRRWRTTG